MQAERDCLGNLTVFSRLFELYLESFPTSTFAPHGFTLHVFAPHLCSAFDLQCFCLGNALIVIHNRIVGQ